MTENKVREDLRLMGKETKKEDKKKERRKDSQKEEGKVSTVKKRIKDQARYIRGILKTGQDGKMEKQEKEGGI